MICLVELNILDVLVKDMTHKKKSFNWIGIKMIDWTKPIFEATSKSPAHFVGTGSEGEVVVEYCRILYFVDAGSGISFGNKTIGFINKPEYRYVPFDSYEEVIPFIGKRVCRCGQSCEITGILIHPEGIGFQLVSNMGYTSIEDSQYMCEKYLFENTNEPVGKKVKV